MSLITYSIRDELSIKFAEKIRKHFSLDRIILFGSTARKDDRIDSDLDICLIGNISRLSHSQRRLVDDIAGDFLLDNGLLINWLYFNDQQWEKNNLPIIKTIKNEGKLLWANEKID